VRFSRIALLLHGLVRITGGLSGSALCLRGVSFGGGGWSSGIRRRGMLLVRAALFACRASFGFAGALLRARRGLGIRLLSDRRCREGERTADK
jgi:hypothetical protein